MSERLDEIRGRVAKATTGPWSATEIKTDRGWEILGFEGVNPAPAYWDTETGYWGPFDEEDAQFVAHAREDVPWLLARLDAVTALVDAAEAPRGRELAEVDRLRAQIDVLRERVRRVQWVHTWTNEDGKRFVFAEDLVEALDGVA